MTAKEHYNTHLGAFYSWMVGDFNTAAQQQLDFFTQQHIKPTKTKIALDLGAGHGIQSLALAKLGFDVTALDFNEQLLSELAQNTHGYKVSIQKDDIKNVLTYRPVQPELIICVDDTLTHLDTFDEVKLFINHCAQTLVDGGQLLLSFRDYSTALTGNARFIPVKSDEEKILTCILDFSDEFVTVTDQLYTKIENNWKQRVSSYKKVRLTPSIVQTYVEEAGFSIQFNEIINRMQTVIAIKSHSFT